MDGVPPKTSYVTRPGRWVGLPKWPAPEIQSQSLPLGNGTLGQDVMASPVAVKSNVSCGQGFGEYFPFGFGPGELPDDQRADDALSACFDTQALSEATPLIGAPRIKLTVSSRTPYAQLAARLCDVAPDGASTLISIGLLNLQFREGFETPKALVPDQDYAITLDLDQAAYVVPKGHRLRLSISPSYWPFIWPERGETTLKISQGTLELPVFHDTGGLEWPCPPLTQSDDPITTVTRSGLEDKRTLIEDGQLKLVIHADHGEVEHPDHSLRTSSEIRETWSINQSDISKASAHIVWNRSVARGDFFASTEIVTQMHSDSDTYFVSLNIRAHDAETCVFERQYQDSFRRDLTLKGEPTNQT
ncbi:CocE/NonD family hydrolase C-terminal non-catalytic domain-containing protein [Litoreibacter arenae]|uniref:Putative glutaryl 7-ACA acylase n=1 Tax=Litoreibacter arenae DSM 19593 TaxID=1123360 RepID=S9Q9Y6_9RHOB|nr:CocE/NonD family hydrolase C-terminal non-catalytic domain-containing protein [Litoreibacter arenae]EPX76832.1 putative glutaryl 7-ACA acylase [Litoreibacter arenae DSM 19593]